MTDFIEKDLVEYFKDALIKVGAKVSVIEQGELPPTVNGVQPEEFEFTHHSTSRVHFIEDFHKAITEWAEDKTGTIVSVRPNIRLVQTQGANDKNSAFNGVYLAIAVSVTPKSIGDLIGIEHAVKAKNLSNLYATSEFNPQLFGHLRSEATCKYPNCIFVISQNLANHLLTSEDDSGVDAEFINWLDVEQHVEKREQGIIGLIHGCVLTCNPELPNNVIFAVGHDASFTNYTTRMRVLK